MDSYYDIDEFSSVGDIQTIYPKNPFDEEGVDNIFGLGNKKKKAERKLAKAEKKLEQGKTGKAEKKIAKAEKLLGKVQSGVDKNQPRIDQLKAQALGISNTTNPAQTENVSTPAGQIGAAAQPPVYDPSTGGGGGGGGDTGSMDMPYSPESNLANPSDEPTGDLATEKELPNVTITGGGDKNKALIYIVLAIIVLVGIMYFTKKGKK